MESPLRKLSTSGLETHILIEAMDDEIHSLNVNETWTLTTLLKGYKPIAFIWINKYKKCILGVEQPMFKVRLVAKSYS